MLYWESNRKLSVVFQSFMQITGLPLTGRLSVYSSNRQTAPIINRKTNYYPEQIP